MCRKRITKLEAAKRQMNEAIQLGQPGPFEMYSFEVVFGNTEQDEFWEP